MEEYVRISRQIRRQGVALAVLSVLLLAPLRAAVIDCNFNGEADGDDLAAGVSSDCNSNAIPDECDGFPLGFSDLESPQALSGSPRVLVGGDFPNENREVYCISIFTIIQARLGETINSGNAIHFQR